MSYDTHCWDLAELFLTDEPLLKGREGELAQHVQTSLEDWIVYERGLIERRQEWMMNLRDVGLAAIDKGNGEARGR